MGITRLSEISTKGVNAGRFDVTSIVSSNLIVTPAITSSGTLKLITWAVGNSGALTRLGDSGDLGSGDSITSVAVPSVCSVGPIPTVFRRKSGEFGRILWKLDPTHGTFTITESGVWGDPVTSLDVEWIASGAIPNVVVWVWRSTLGDLHLQSYRASGALFGPLGAAKAGWVSAIGHPILGDVLVTPVLLDCSDIAKLIAWRLEQDGTLVRIGDSGDAAGIATRIAAAHIGGKWATAVRAGREPPIGGGLAGAFAGFLKIAFWHRSNGSFKRIGEQLSSVPIADVDATGLDFNSETGFGAKEQYRIVTAVRTSNSKLRLMVWAWRPGDSKIELDSDSGEQPEPIGWLRLLDCGGLFVTVVRDDTLTQNPDDPDGDPIPMRRLKLISWRIT